MGLITSVLSTHTRIINEKGGRFDDAAFFVSFEARLLLEFANGRLLGCLTFVNKS